MHPLIQGRGGAEEKKGAKWRDKEENWREDRSNKQRQLTRTSGHVGVEDDGGGKRS